MQSIASLRDCPSPAPPEAKRKEDAQPRYKALVAMVVDIDWGQVVRDATRGQVTKTELVHIPISDLEAAWKLSGDEFLNAAVADIQGSIVPAVLRQAWMRALKGEPVQILASQKFWNSTVSRPFLSFGGCPTCTS